MKSLFYFALFALTAITTLHAQEEDEVVAKLREALRSTMMQLRDAQGQIAALQATEIANKQEIDKLKGELKKSGEDLMSERNASANTVADLNAKLSERDATILGNTAALDKWRIDFNNAIERARKAEADSAKKAGQIIVLERLVSEQRIQNIQMYKAGMEVLDRYDKFWFGDALLAREPFVGNTKVKLQNLAQDGQDKLLAARIREENIPGQKKKPAPEPAASPTPEPTAQPSPTPQSANPPSAKPSPTPKPAKQPAPKPTPAKPKKGESGTQWPSAEPA